MTSKPRTDIGGNWPVMITPFNNDKSIDWKSFDRLTDWYLAAGISGLFAVCQSSEMFDLSGDERLEIATRLVKRVGEKVPILATGTFSYDVETQAEFIKKMYDTGVDAVICLANQLAKEEENDDIWKKNADQLMKKTDDIPLGIYECPAPYHRLLDVEMVKWISETGRFYWYKETSENIVKIKQKTKITKGSNFSLYNAHTRSLLASLRSGTIGFTGIADNYFPALFSWLCENYDKEPKLADELHGDFMWNAQLIVDTKYPHSAKKFLNMLGVIDTVAIRRPAVEWSDEELNNLKQMRKNAEKWHEKLGLSPLV